MTLPRVSRQTLSTFALTVWTILVGGVRVFAWDSLKEGFIDVRPLARVPRFLSIVGIVVVLTFIVSILFNDTLRMSGRLEPLPLSSSATRGIFVPSTAVPLALSASILAWTLLLTGALHVRAFVRWSVLACFLFFELSAILSGVLQGAGTDEQGTLLLITAGITLLALLGMLAAFLLLPRFRLPLYVEFLVMLGLVGGLFLLGLWSSLQASQLGSIDFVSGYLVPDIVTNPRNLIVPLLYLAGAEMVNFGIALSSWGTQSARAYGRLWTLIALLLALLAYRWFSFVTGALVPGVSPDQLMAWAGALLAGLVLVPIALWRARKPFPDRVPLKVVLGLIIGMLLPQLLLLVVINFGLVLFLTAYQDPNVLANMDQVSRPLLAVSDAYSDILYLGLALAGAVITVIAIRRRRYTVAAFGMILGWTQLVWWFMQNGRPLQEWRYHYQDLDLWILAALTTLSLYWLVRRELNAARALALLGLTFFGWVLNFTDFLDNPLSLFFGFAGIFFTVFGILWGVLTAGGKFANYDSPAFPRINRIILYLGYVLLTVNVTHWFTVTHNVQEQVFNSDLTAAGLRIFGLTAAYLVFVEGGRALLTSQAQ